MRISVKANYYPQVALSHLANGKHKSKAKLANDLKGFKEFEAWLEKQAEPSTLIVMDATSVYHLKLAEFVYNKGYPDLRGESGHDSFVCR